VSVIIVYDMVLGAGGDPDAPAPPSELISPVPPPLGGPYPLGHARIGYHNGMAGSTVAPASAQVVLNRNTYQAYTTQTGDLIEITQDSAVSFDYVGLGAHNFHSTQTKITITYSPTSDGTDFIQLYTGIPKSDRALMILLGHFSTIRRLRILVEEPGNGTARLAVVYAGIALQMERPLYGGHTPINFSARTDYQNNVTDSGNWLGRTIQRRGLDGTYNWEHLTDAWIRFNFEHFMIAAKTTPFFIAWSPLDHPSEVAYCWTTAEIRPSNMGIRDLMQVTLEVEGYGV